MRIERQYRGVPLWVIRNYLTELNGKRTGEHLPSFLYLNVASLSHKRVDG